jgi:hypothetical protein
MRTIAWMLLFTAPIFGAPLPKARPKPPIPQRLTTDYLVGDWLMIWNGTRYPTTLERSGKYTCRFGSITYVGSWGIDREGRFWVTESSRPQEVCSWQSYVVRIKPGTLSGVMEVGAPGVGFRLEKRKK